MKRTFCDRCGVECNGQSVQRFTIFDVNRAIDVCEDCYSEFFRWLNSEKDKPTPLGVHYSGEIISLDKDGKPIMNKDDSDGVDEFIKDVKNDSDDVYDIHKGCDGCMYHHLGWHQEPCEQCIRKRYSFCEKIEVSDSDNYINKEKKDEN